MAKKLKKGAKRKLGKGPSASYITRAAALKKTQLRLAEFRRMCILKGVYPREPKKKLRGPNATYYHSKDILFLNKDPLMPLFRAEKAHQKRIKKAVGRRELSVARHFVRTKPTYTLNHLVKERYPTLLDAVRDLDDPLSTLALFASLPSDETKAIPQKPLDDSVKFVDQFHFLVGERGFLRKAFASIKGYYFQADILGHGVTWLVPHQYTQELPYEVDFRVMLTFQEFHCCLVKFVNYKLYALNGFTYPPAVDHKSKRAGVRHLAMSAIQLDAAQQGSGENEDADMDGDDEEAGAASAAKTPVVVAERSKGVFDGLTVFISREVPLGPLSIVLRSGGAVLAWDNESSPIEMEDPSITHQLVDRTNEQMESLYDTWQDLPPRTFVQPQWALDCMNNNCLLPTEPYRPGVRPPPHLSPFVNDIKEGYVPKQREILDSLVAEKRKSDKKSKQATKIADDEDDDEDGDEVDVQADNVALVDKFQSEIDKERQGQWFSHELTPTTGTTPEAVGTPTRGGEIAKELFGSGNLGSKAIRKKKREQDEIARRTALMSNRKRKLKNELDQTNDQLKKKAERLEAKRKLRESKAN